MEDTRPSLSPRRRAIYEGHPSLAPGAPMTVLSFDFPLPPSRKGRSQPRDDNKPDFSAFSWKKQPRLGLPETALLHAAPVSPRTMPCERPVIAAAVSDTQSAE
ncbi:d8c886ee-6d5c-4a71-9ca1-a29524aade48 [Thermothielavioides terrestris]|jgi:hypothetical protein|uniref:D8c886ee-6d5c-4a71-9ca1-a29524aade48 n=1 Tax=Thermothielavioides terrestris TaxID=2587410 RepID=A0A3S4AMM1_9PEZI|nr:d8c886ee-6d5c-4a71-9ca1-a29524aade48 [Thermothielavioides terrestris]